MSRCYQANAYLFTRVMSGMEKRMTYCTFTSMLKSVLCSLRLPRPVTQYSGLSFRTGGATQALYTSTGCTLGDNLKAGLLGFPSLFGLHCLVSRLRVCKILLKRCTFKHFIPHDTVWEESELLGELTFYTMCFNIL